MDTEKLSKLELLPMLVNAAIDYANRCGKDEKLEGLPGTVRTATAERLCIVYRTPSAMAHGESNFGLDIWFDNKKVFSVCWNCNKLKDYEIVRFQRGPWVTSILGEVLYTEAARIA
jgi:hypothetical protein